MPLKSGIMTPQEQAFIGYYVQLHDGVAAAKLAGFSRKDYGAELLRKPAIAAAIADLSSAWLHGEGKHLAINHLITTLQDKTATIRDKNAAAGLVLKHCATEEERNQAKELHEMDADEIQARIAALQHRQGQILEGAKVIDATPVEEPGDLFD